MRTSACYPGVSSQHFLKLPRSRPGFWSVTTFSKRSRPRSKAPFWVESILSKYSIPPPPSPHFFESCVRFPTPPFYESWAKIVPNNRVLVHWQYASKTHTWNSTSGEKGNIKCASWTHALASVSFSMATYTSAVTKHIICLQMVKWNKLTNHFPEWLNRNE